MTFMMNFPIAGATYYKLDPQSNGLMVSSFGAMNLVREKNWHEFTSRPNMEYKNMAKINATYLNNTKIIMIFWDINYSWFNLKKIWPQNNITLKKDRLNTHNVFFYNIPCRCRVIRKARIYPDSWSVFCHGYFHLKTILISSWITP